MLTLLVSFFAIATQGPTESTPTIPLNSIWAWEMPGTKDVRKLEQDFDKFKNLVADEQIQRSVAVNTFSLLSRRVKHQANNNAGSAFVVDAIGLEALKKANAILRKIDEPKEKFKAGTPLTLVFYAYGSSQFVRISEVIKNPDEIIVKFHFHDHGHRMSTKHFALVPLGDNLKGRIKVTVKRTEDTAEENLSEARALKFSDLDAKRLVSGSTEFQVLEPPE